MALVRFAFICDHCQKRGDEYGYMSNCYECEKDICSDCRSQIIRDYDQGGPDEPITSEISICNRCDLTPGLTGLLGPLDLSVTAAPMAPLQLLAAA